MPRAEVRVRFHGFRLFTAESGAAAYDWTGTIARSSREYLDSLQAKTLTLYKPSQGRRYTYLLRL